MNATGFVAILDARDCRPAKNGAGWKARCPAHEDQNPSLSVSEGADGRVLVKCHAECSFDAIVSSLGLKKTDFFSEKTQAFPASKAPGLGRIVATYPYRDESDALLFEVVRFDPKDFRQRRPDPNGKGGWSWSVHGVRRVLFRLPETLAAIHAARAIWIAEGEKDVLALVNAGLDASCNPGGAGKWLPEYAESLRSAHVVVIADKDSPGRNHAQAVARLLHAAAASVRIVEVPDANGKPCKDASDFFGAGGEARELLDIARDASLWPSIQTEAAPQEGSGELPPDMPPFESLPASTPHPVPRAAASSKPPLVDRVFILPNELLPGSPGVFSLSRIEVESSEVE